MTNLTPSEVRALLEKMQVNVMSKDEAEHLLAALKPAETIHAKREKRQ